MNVLVFADPTAASLHIVDEVSKIVRERPEVVLGLATGGTPTDVYRELVRRQQAGDIDLSGVTTFNLDEYVGLSPEHPQSFASFMRHHLFDHVGLSVDRTHLPPGRCDDFSAAARDYEADIARHGGIDWQLLGIGDNGHIAFNEPGSPAGSRTRIVQLTAETIEANSRFFDDPRDVPRRAITMGIGTILEAKRIRLLAFGAQKAAAVAAAIQGPVGDDCPASFLRRHPDVTFVLDRAAAGRLQREVGANPES